MSMTAPFPVCPRCDKSVVSDHDRHELRFQLVNAAVENENTLMHGVFHHRCAAAIWNAAREEWNRREPS